nr:hypothetical protein BaRGS_025245 [Batillaria attramentaria]
MLAGNVGTNEIIRLDMETLSYIKIPVADVTSPKDIVYDPVDDRIYWTANKTIETAVLHGAYKSVLPNLDNDLSLPNARVLIAEVEDTLNKTALQTNQTVVDNAVMNTSRLMEANIDVLQKDNIIFRLLAAIEFVSQKGALSDGCVCRGTLARQQAAKYGNMQTGSRDMYKRGDQVPPEHSQILSLVSYAGCGVSLLALILTILTYCLCNPLASRSTGSGGFRIMKRLEIPHKILISLCLALALTDLVFVAGMQNYTFHSPTACKAVSMVLHFSLLSSMCWMSVEAFYMYLAFVRVFRSNITHFMLKASCFGWGVPLVIVAVTVGVNTTDNYALLDSGICWLTGVAFYVAFVAPVCLILLFNVISFLLVLRVILGMTNNKLNSTQSTQAVQKIRRAVGVIILLGLTWVFGFLAIDGATQIVFHYLFAIFNSLQGLFIFLFYCVFNKDARAAYTDKAGWVRDF